MSPPWCIGNIASHLFAIRTMFLSFFLPFVLSSLLFFGVFSGIQRGGVGGGCKLTSPNFYKIQVVNFLSICLISLCIHLRPVGRALIEGLSPSNVLRILG
jgi:hypothetical protein